jgi:hypothetical protein
VQSSIIQLFLYPTPLVSQLRFDRAIAAPASRFLASVSGSNLTLEMFFDVRLTSPESNESVVALNWQNGLAENHEVPAGLAPENWTITGVRAHEIETDHTGNSTNQLSITLICSGGDFGSLVCV